LVTDSTQKSYALKQIKLKVHKIIYANNNSKNQSKPANLEEVEPPMDADNGGKRQKRKKKVIL
jgi:hypothetical protein